MFSRISRLIAVGAVVAAAGGVCAGVANAASASPAASGTEHFNLMTTLPNSSKYVMIASGVFTAGGVDTQGSSTDVAKFANGSFKIHHGGALHIIKEQVNQKTCLAVFEGKTPFTLGNGTGAYKKLSGSGTATISELAIFPRSHGQCNSNANPLTNEQTITATAHVKL
jgi:hypothetical protein